MARFHATPQGNIPFTLAEEAAQDAVDAAYAAGAARRTAQAQIAALEALQTPRFMREAVLPVSPVITAPSHPFVGQTAAQALAAINTQITALRLI